MPPCEYIQMKRIERAQTLLLTSHMSIIEIAEKSRHHQPFPVFPPVLKDGPLFPERVSCETI